MLSADGQVVVIHDFSVDRTTDGTGLVASLTLPEIKHLDAGIKYGPAFRLERIPTLAEVFETIGNKLIINVEIKNYESPFDDLPDRVVGLIKEYGLDESVFLSSFNFLALARARSLMPEIPMGLITFKGFANPALRSRLIRFGPRLALNPNYLDVTPKLIKAARAARCRIHPFTVNQPEEIKNMFMAGVDGIFTSDPITAKNVLASISS